MRRDRIKEGKRIGEKLREFSSIIKGWENRGWKRWGDMGDGETSRQGEIEKIKRETRRETNYLKGTLVH